MGKRYLTCVVKDGGYKIAQYGQHDGYPEWAGKNILSFLLLSEFDLEDLPTEDDFLQECLVFSKL